MRRTLRRCKDAKRNVKSSLHMLPAKSCKRKRLPVFTAVSGDFESFVQYFPDEPVETAQTGEDSHIFTAAVAEEQ